MLFIGCGNDRLMAMDMSGNQLWNACISRIATVFASWEKPYPQVLAVKCAESDNKTVVIAGCGDDHVRIFDLTGHMLKALYTYATVPDTLELCDIDADGELEILAAGKEASHQGEFYVFDLNGDPGDHIYTGVWLCNIRSYYLGNLNEKFVLVCGMTFGENFKIIEISEKQQKTIAVKMLGGAVNAMCTDIANNTIYTGTSKGFVMSHTGSAENRWYLDVKRPVLDLFKPADELITLCGGGQILGISEAGEIMHIADLPSQADCWLKTENGILTGCGNTLYLCCT
jgi:hypothetical protein